MSTWRTFFWRLWPWKRSNEDEKSSLKSNDSTVNRFDQYALIIENIAVWENPLVSAACVLLVNLLFWLIYSFERKFYCVLTLIVWLILFYNFWNEHIFPFMKTQSTNFAVFGDWCYRSCSAPSVKEGGRYYFQLRACVLKFYCWMVKFRQEYPGLFCVWALLFLVVVAALGQAVPGFLLAYTCSMLLLVGPGIVLHLLPPSATERLRTLSCLLLPTPTAPGDSEVDEYLPESNQEALAVLSHAATDLSAVGEEEEEEVDPLFIPEGDGNHTNGGDSSSRMSALELDLGVSRMPPHDDQESLEGSLDAPEEFELSPYQVDGVLGAERIRRRKGVRREEEEGAMRFESMHFEQGSSSEEEEAFSRGLRGVAHDEGEALSGQMGHLLGQLLVRSGAVASVVRGALSAQPLQRVSGATGQRNAVDQPRSKVEEESDEEDFEMISEEDLS